MKNSLFALRATTLLSGMAFAPPMESGSGSSTPAAVNGQKRDRQAGSVTALGLAAKTTGLLGNNGAVFAPADGRDSHVPGTWKFAGEIDGASGDEITGLTNVAEDQRTAQIG